jgi:hypothetical protein
MLIKNEILNLLSGFFVEQVFAQLNGANGGKKGKMELKVA